MSDVTFALEAKSDQLNAVDLMAENRIIKIRDVKVKKGEQPVSIFFDGDNNKPWKPSKGMLRILASAWGTDSKNWIAKKANIYFEPSVLWAGKEVGGIRIKSLSDIDPKGLSVALVISKQKRETCVIPLLAVRNIPYPTDKFETAFNQMVDAMRTGKMTLQALIAHCQKTGELSQEQLKRLEDAAPVESEDDIFPGDIK